MLRDDWSLRVKSFTPEQERSVKKHMDHFGVFAAIILQIKWAWKSPEKAVTPSCVALCEVIIEFGKSQSLFNYRSL